MSEFILIQNIILYHKSSVFETIPFCKMMLGFCECLTLLPNFKYNFKHWVYLVLGLVHNATVCAVRCIVLPHKPQRNCTWSHFFFYRFTDLSGRFQNRAGALQDAQTHKSTTCNHATQQQSNSRNELLSRINGRSSS